MVHSCQAQMASQRSAAERELDTAVATLSADLNTKEQGWDV